MWPPSNGEASVLGLMTNDEIRMTKPDLRAARINRSFGASLVIRYSDFVILPPFRFSAATLESLSSFAEHCG
jgi:hypothetical protein